MTNSDLFRAAHAMTRSYLDSLPAWTRRALDYKACFVGALAYIRTNGGRASIIEDVKAIAVASGLFTDVSRWQKAGHDRLYLNAAQQGRRTMITRVYVDLTTGRLSFPTDRHGRPDACSAWARDALGEVFSAISARLGA